MMLEQARRLVMLAKETMYLHPLSALRAIREILRLNVNVTGDHG
jgi:hypothetical protein